MNYSTESEAYQALLEQCKNGEFILTSGEIHPDILTIHDLPKGETKHCGFGLFIGTTSNGNKFTFDGGGAMRRFTVNEKHFISWCFLYGADGASTKNVADDIGYNYDAMITALEGLS